MSAVSKSSGVSTRLAAVRILPVPERANDQRDSVVGVLDEEHAKDSVHVGSCFTGSALQYRSLFEKCVDNGAHRATTVCSPIVLVVDDEAPIRQMMRTFHLNPRAIGCSKRVAMDAVQPLTRHRPGGPSHARHKCCSAACSEVGSLHRARLQHRDSR